MRKRPCHNSRCPGKVDRGRFCDRCQGRSKPTSESRKESNRFYASTAWRNKREEALIRDNYCCQECKEEGKTVRADDVDHIKPRSSHPELELEISNLRSLCKSHHSRKTRRNG